MTKKHSLTYCLTCADPLIGKGAYLMTHYATICEHYAATGHCFLISDPDKGSGRHEMTKYLENEGYVLTTEKNEHILAVMPTNHHCSTSKGHLYCFQPEEHFPEFVEDNDCEC